MSWEKEDWHLEAKLQKREKMDNLRVSIQSDDLVDLASNDYLGLASEKQIFDRALELLERYPGRINGSGGSRLLTGNHPLYEIAEGLIAGFHSAEAALIFNSGYQANLGFFQSVPGREDFVIFDEAAHASIREGLRLSLCRSVKFRHNSPESLEEQIRRCRSKKPAARVYVITESVFSMDGTQPPLEIISKICLRHRARLIVDEAHATGVVGERGEGLVSALGLEGQVFARIITFGKAVGSHGAAILGSNTLKKYLLNFARSLIYTTALPPHSLAGLVSAYEFLNSKAGPALEKLRANIAFFSRISAESPMSFAFVPSASAVQICIIPGNLPVKEAAERIRKQGMDVRPILSPTVPEGKERLRFCLHSFNTEEHISAAVAAAFNENRKS